MPIPVEQRALAGDAGVFDRRNSRVEIPDRPALHVRRALTLTAWVKPARIAGTGTIVGKWYAPDSYLLLVEDGRFVFSVAMPGGRFGVAHRLTA
ncbi:MAG TPA: hypothetical protein VFF06_11100 [Polyangia bacterium]|nr:hypothetical protein [Polyangia bacterium]